MKFLYLTLSLTFGSALSLLSSNGAAAAPAQPVPMVVDAPEIKEKAAISAQAVHMNDATQQLVQLMAAKWSGQSRQLILSKIQTLIAQGADLTVTSGPRAWTIMHFAAFHKDEAMIQCLKAKEPNLLHARDGQGNTPLQTALAPLAKGKFPLNYSLLSLLMSKRAIRNRNLEGDDALKFASKHGDYCAQARILRYEEPMSAASASATAQPAPMDAEKTAFYSEVFENVSRGGGYSKNYKIIDNVLYTKELNEIWSKCGVSQRWLPRR